MNLNRLELQKLIVNRRVLLAITAIFFLNLITSYYIYQDQEAGRVTYSSASYRAVYKDLENMDAEQAYAYLENYLNEIIQMDGETEKQKFRYTGEAAAERFLISEIMSSLDQCIHYDDYLNRLDEGRGLLEEAGLLQIATLYQQRNVAKQNQDKEIMRERKIEYGPSKGIRLFGDTVTTDFFVMLILMLLVVQLVTREKETEQIRLYRATGKGHIHLILAKITATLVCTVVISMIFWVSNLMIAGSLYGLGDLHRLIQSVDVYRDCLRPITVVQFLGLFFLFKILIYTCLALSLIFLAIMCNQAQVLYFIVVVVNLIEAVLYFSIQESSRWILWKYLNFFAMLKVGSVIGNYRNINIVNVPHPYLMVFLIVTILLSILFFSVSVNCFSCQTERKRIDQKSWYYRLPWVNWSEKSLSLFHQESYKLWMNGRFLYVLLGYLLFVVMTYQPASKAFYIAEDPYYDMYIDYAKGPVTEETEALISREDQKFALLEEQYANGEITEEYWDSQMRPYQAFERLRDVTTVHLKKTDGEYLHTAGYQLLTGDYISHQKDIKLGLLALVVMLYPLAYLFGIDHQLQTVSVLRATVYGRRRSLFIRIALGIFVVTSIYLLTYVPFYYSVLSEFGTESIHAPACSLLHLGRIPHSISLLQYLVLIAVLRYLGYLLVMTVMLWISGRTASVIGACVLGILVLVLPLVFVYLQVPGMSYVLLNPLIIGNVFG